MRSHRRLDQQHRDERQSGHQRHHRDWHLHDHLHGHRQLSECLSHGDRRVPTERDGQCKSDECRRWRILDVDLEFDQRDLLRREW